MDMQLYRLCLYRVRDLPDTFLLPRVIVAEGGDLSQPR